MSQESTYQVYPAITDAGPSALDPKRGRVVFVGVTFADVETLTLAGVRALAEADAVLPDSECSAAVLADPRISLRADVVIEPFSDGTELLERVAATVRAAASGRQVVRLVNGEPLLERDILAEANLCAEAGCQLDIVPGVTALTAVPSYAGICYDVAEPCQFVVVPASAESVEVAGAGNVVVRCGGAVVDKVVAAALRSGRPAEEQVLVTFDGGSVWQQSQPVSLLQLVELVESRGALGQQLTITLGQAAHRHEQLNWFESKPLFGWHVLVPRTRDLGCDLDNRLRNYGATIQNVATISVEPPRSSQQMERALHGLVDGRYQWLILSGSHSVRAIREGLESYGLDARALSGINIAAIGNDAVEALGGWGVRADLVPNGAHTSAQLVAEFPAFDDLLDPMNRILLPRADLATQALVSGLAQLGWEVEDITAYRTVRAAPPPADVREAIKSGAFDAVVFTSSSTVRNLIGIAGKPPPQTLVAAIGEATAQSCSDHGLRVDAMPDSPTARDLVDALAVLAANRRAQMLARGEEPVRPSLMKKRRR